VADLYILTNLRIPNILVGHLDDDRDDQQSMLMSE